MNCASIILPVPPSAASSALFPVRGHLQKAKPLLSLSPAKSGGATRNRGTEGPELQARLRIDAGWSEMNHVHSRTLV